MELQERSDGNSELHVLLVPSAVAAIQSFRKHYGYSLTDAVNALVQIGEVVAVLAKDHAILASNGTEEHRIFIANVEGQIISG